MVTDCTVEKSLETFFKKNTEIQNQDSYAVAVSGGADSMALVQALYLWGVAHSKIIHVLTVDHGLRAESAVEASQVSDWVWGKNDKNFLHKTLIWEGDKPEASVQEEARAARYKLIADYCSVHQIKTLFVGHHQDDQAETFLIRLSKGSGLDGLAAMVMVQKYNDDLNIARPFLDIIKTDLTTYCEEKNIDYVSDPSNENVNYLRPRLRQSMGILKEEGLSAKRLSTLSRRLRRARNALERISQKSYDACLKEKTKKSIILDFKKLQGETEEIAFRVIQKAVEDKRRNQGYGVRMDRLENLFESLWHNPISFKPRTLGGFLFALKDENSSLYIEEE